MVTTSEIEDLETQYKNLKTILKGTIEKYQETGNRAKEIGLSVPASQFETEIQFLRGYEEDLDKQFKELEIIKIRNVLESAEMDVNKIKNECLTFNKSVDQLRNSLSAR